MPDRVATGNALPCPGVLLAYPVAADDPSLILRAMRPPAPLVPVTGGAFFGANAKDESGPAYDRA